MQGPKWIKNFLDDAQVRAIGEAVKKAETTTTGEIVTVIVRKSSDTYWIPVVLSLLFFSFFLIAGGFQFIDHEFQLRISSEWVHTAAYVALLPIYLILFLIALGWSSSSLVQRFFVPDHIQSAEVERRAFFEFAVNQVNKTHEQTGILIFISLMEHNTVVLADRGIAAKLPPATWNEIVQMIIQSIKDGKTADGLSLAIERCGKLLSEHFPAKEKNPNELPDHLIIKE